MLYNNKKMEGKIMAKMIYLIRWFDGIKETREIYEGRTPDDVKYVLDNAEDYEEKDIDSLIVYENANGRTASLKYVNLNDLVEAARELAYPSEDADEMIDKLYLRIADEYKDYEDSGNIIEDYIEDIKEKIYQMI